MPVTLTKAPQPIAFSKNPIEVQLLSSDYMAVIGSFANAQLIVNNPPLPGAVLTLNWSAKVLVFTFALTPDTSGTQLPSGDASLTYVASLVPYLQANFYLNRDFTIAYVAGTNNITLTSKIKSSVYSLSRPVTETYPTVLSATPGVTPVIKPNFTHLLEVWAMGAPDVKLYSGNLQLDFPVSGLSKKDISDILNSYLKYDVPNTTTFWQPCTYSFIQYYLKYAQSFGDIPAVAGVNQTGTYFAYMGGYSNAALNVIPTADHLQTYLMPTAGSYQSQKWFESFPVDHVTVKTNTPQFLYFVNNRTVAETYKLQIVMTFDNTLTRTITRAGGTLNPFNKVAVNCSYSALYLGGYADTTKKIVSFTVQLLEFTSGNPRSAIKTFIVDHTWEPYTRYILYGDSAGNFKTLRLFGKSQLNTDVADNQAQRFEDQTTPSLGNITRYDILSVETDGVNTGYINNKADYDNLKEILLSKVAYRVIDGVLVPINIISKKFDYSADAKNLNGYKLEYQLAYQEKNYTGNTTALPIPQLNSAQPAPAELPSTPAPVQHGFPFIFPFPSI